MKSLMKFEHKNAATIEEATSLLNQYGNKAWVIAGGTDVIGTMRFEILRDYPEVLVNLKTIPGLDAIGEHDGVLKIGALTRLQDIATNALISDTYAALSQAAGRTASPHVREMGTIGGNICQLIRCWYFRKEENRFDCIRKGGARCHAVLGDNRYHSIFGAVKVGDPPCAQSCPASTDIPGYLAAFRNGNIAEAASHLLDYNPLPSITGRVCPRFCERECNRNELDEAVSIRSIERAVGDYLLDHADEMYRAPKKGTGKKAAIIGSGPAGLSTAYYLRKLGHEVTVFEAFEEAGGMLRYGIPPYRLPKDILNRQVKALENMGIEFHCVTSIGDKMPFTELRNHYDAVFCSNGAWNQPSLGLNDEGLLTSGLTFLTRVNQGFREVTADKILVIGGGSVAMDVAITARRLGVKDITVACLESEAEMPALREEVEQAVQEGIKLLPSWGPSGVLKRKGKLIGMELKRCVSVYDSEGRFSPIYDASVKEKVEADQVILAIGQQPDLSFAGNSLEVRRGLIIVDPDTQATELAGVYAGGDATVSSGSASVVGAIAAGRRAAVSMNLYLGGKPAPLPEKQTDYLTRSSNEYLENLPRMKAPKPSFSQVSLDAEDVPGLELGMIETETNRCFNCGCDGVNPSDIAPALVALDATIITSSRAIKADDFWAADRGFQSTMLENGEIIIEIQIPKPKPNVKSAYIKFAMRKSIDFPIVNCAAAIESENSVVKSARICLNAVYGKPYRVFEAEKYMIGKQINEATAEAAGVAAVANAIALPYNKFKIQIAKTMVKRVLLACK